MTKWKCWAVAGICLAAAGCGGGAFPVAKTSGQVLCEGVPVPQAFVYFEPLQTGSAAIVGKAAFARADDQGRFVLTTYSSNDGAVVGKHRVRVDRPGYDCACVLNSEVDVMEVEIVAGKQNEFEVNLPKKTGRERPAFDREDDDDD
jgi:hypothetical protein